MTNSIPSLTGPTIAINVKLLATCLFGWMSWSIWPASPEWWAFGLLSICLALAALTSFVGAAKLILRVQKREQAIREYLALGVEPKSSELASVMKLRDAGMR